MIRLLVTASLLTLAACATPQKRDDFVFTRVNGQRVMCSQWEIQPCGAHLWRCSTESEYFCVVDIEVVSIGRTEGRMIDMMTEMEQ